MSRYSIKIGVIHTGHKFYINTNELQETIDKYCSSKIYQIIGVSFCIELGGVIP